MRALIQPQEPDYAVGLDRTTINVYGPEWAAYKEICEEMGITASAGVRQLIRRVVRSHRNNG